MSAQSLTSQSPSPLAVIEAVYQAFEQRDVAAVLARFDEQIEISQSAALPWGGVHRGVDEALQFFATLSSRIETRVKVERMIVAGDEVVEIGRTCGRALATGRQFEIDEVHIWRLRDGKVVSMHAIVDDAAMLAALGADELSRPVPRGVVDEDSSRDQGIRRHALSPEARED